MKRKIFLILLASVLFGTVYAGGLKAYLSYAAFNTPDNQPYLETYLTVKGSSVNLIPVDDKFQGTVEVQIIFRKNDSIVNFAKYELSGPKVNDTLGTIPNFLDVQRYSLDNGKYDIEFKINDKNSDAEALTSFDQYSIEFPENEASFSDIEFLNTYSKSEETDNLSRNGYRLVPYIFNYYPENTNTLSFYSEMYNSEDKVGEAFLLNYYIRPFEINKKLSNYYSAKRKTSKSVNPVLGSFDISTLPSGNYLLVIEARDRNNKLISKKESFFQRFKPGLGLSLDNVYALDASSGFVNEFRDHDTLAMYISWLKPISTDAEKLYTQSLLNADSDIEDMKKYFLNFWVERDESYPFEAWAVYKSKVQMVNNDYSTQNTPGFDTDRGRVYLQYGAPNVISEQHNEPNAFPYEIWHYYSMPDGQKDKKFVFYTQEIATNDFELIHSTAIGELSNYKWRIWINNRDTRYTNLMNVDDTHYREIWGGRQDDYYYQPR